MRKIILLAYILIVSIASNAQQAVGIGTNSPHSSAQLDVVSTTKGLLIPRMNAGQRTGILNPVAGLMVYETTTNSFWFYNGSGWSQIGTGGASPWTVSGTNIYNSNSGNVGIGIPAPLEKLHLVGDFKLDNGSIRMETAGGGGTIQFLDASENKTYIQLSGNNLRMGTNSGNGTGKMIIRMDGTDRVVVDSIGQVGIGRITPSERLDVDGKIRITPFGSSVASDAELKMYGNPFNASNNFGPAQISFYNWIDVGGGNYDYEKKYKIEFEAGLAERIKLHHLDFPDQLVLTKTGRVGVNTSGPTEEFEVKGNAEFEGGAPLLKFRSTSLLASAVTGIEFNGSSANKGKIVYTDGGLFLSGRESSSVFSDLVLKEGNVGINATNPTEKLHVVGNALFNYANPTIQFQHVGVDKGFIQVNGNDLRIGTNASNLDGKFVVRTSSGDNFFIDNAGYLGIGVSAPGAHSRVHIGTGLDASLTSNGYMMIGNSDGSNLVFDNNEIMARSNGAGGSLVLQNDGGTVRIGNVAVPAGYKFAINGKMICEELKVKLASSGWPDYVFSEKYKLPSLFEVEKYIQQHKHLPNIPSAAEVEKNGIEVGDMQKRMMEKIEELTLYIIDLKKEIELLKVKK